MTNSSAVFLLVVSFTVTTFPLPWRPLNYMVMFGAIALVRIISGAR